MLHHTYPGLSRTRGTRHSWEPVRYLLVSRAREIGAVRVSFVGVHERHHLGTAGQITNGRGAWRTWRNRLSEHFRGRRGCEAPRSRALSCAGWTVAPAGLHLAAGPRSDPVLRLAPRLRRHREHAVGLLHRGRGGSARQAHTPSFHHARLVSSSLVSPSPSPSPSLSHTHTATLLPLSVSQRVRQT